MYLASLRLTYTVLHAQFLIRQTKLKMEQTDLIEGSNMTQKNATRLQQSLAVEQYWKLYSEDHKKCEQDIFLLVRSIPTSTNNEPVCR